METACQDSVGLALSLTLSSFLGYHIYHQCCFPSLAMLTSNNEQPLIPWSLMLKSLRTRQMSNSSYKPGSPTVLWPKEFYPSHMKTKKADLHQCPHYWETLSCQICSLRNTLCFHGSNGNSPRFFFQQSTLRSQALAVTFSPLPISIPLNQQPLPSEAAASSAPRTRCKPGREASSVEIGFHERQPEQNGP